MCACANDDGEKINVLIVSLLLPIAVNFTLRSNTKRRIEVLDAIANISASRGYCSQNGRVRADRVSGRAEHLPQTRPLASQDLVAPEWAVQVLVWS